MTRKKQNWAYFAGLFDGEGCIHIAEITFRDRPHGLQLGYRLDMHVTMTDKKTIEWVVQNFGGAFYISRSKNVKWKDAYRWQPRGKKHKEHILLGLLPYLITKERLAGIALEFIRLTGMCPEKRKAFCDAARLLSRRGNTVEANTSDLGIPKKIESELTGDRESVPTVM